MQLHIRHETHYVYEDTVSYSIQALKLTPRSEPGQRVVTWRVTSPGERIEQVDPYGIAEISDVVEATPETSRLSPLTFLAPTPLTRPDAALRALADHCLGRHPASRRSLADLVDSIRHVVAYTPGVTDVTHSASEVLELGVGVCQDQAHVLVACCRTAGIPARYVSGYFHAGDNGEIASHAWADVWLGADQGWLSLDVTHAEETGGRHCRLAVGRDYLDAAPVRGVRRGGGKEAMTVTVRVSGGQANQQ